MESATATSPIPPKFRRILCTDNQDAGNLEMLALAVRKIYKNKTTIRDLLVKKRGSRGFLLKSENLTELMLHKYKPTVSSNFFYLKKYRLFV